MADDNDVVTGETLSTYTADKLGWTLEPATEVVEGDGEGEGDAGELEDKSAKTLEAGEAEQEEGAEKVAPKPKSKLELRMSELTAQRKAAEARAEAAEARAAELERKTPATASAAEREEVAVEEFPGRPDSAKYTDAYKYAEDLADWKVKEAFAKKDREDLQKQQVNDRQKVADTWVSRQKELEQEYPDYLEVANSLDVVVSNEVRDAIIESEVGPRILYYLGQNPDEAKRIAGMKMGPALKAIGRLEANLEPAAKADPEQKGDPKPMPKPAVKPSNAPAPIKPLNGKVAIDSRVDSDGNYIGDYEQYKLDRASGKLK